MMKAVASVPGSNKVWVCEVPEPQPEDLQPRQVLIKAVQVGICATDREVVSGLGEAPPDDDKLILGHELLGQVKAVGEDVQKVKVGDWVTATVRRGCGQCVSCLNNESDMCFTGNYVERGIFRAHGYLSEWLVEDETYLLPVPDEILDIAVLLEPTSICTKVVEHLRVINRRILYPCEHPEHSYDSEEWGRDKRALIAGAGPIGTLLASLCLMAGAHVHIFATRPPDSPKAKLVESLGAHYFSTKERSPTQVAKDVGGFDFIADTTAVASVCAELIPCLRENGVLAFVGTPADDASVSLKQLIWQMLLKNQILIGFVNSNLRHFQLAAAALTQMKKTFGEKVFRIIGARYPLEQADVPILKPDPDVIKSVVMVEA